MNKNDHLFVQNCKNNFYIKPCQKSVSWCVRNVGDEASRGSDGCVCVCVAK